MAYSKAFIEAIIKDNERQGRRIAELTRELDEVKMANFQKDSYDRGYKAAEDYYNYEIEILREDNNYLGDQLHAQTKRNEKLKEQIDFLNDCIEHNHTNFRNVFYRAFDAECQLIDAQNEIKELKARLGEEA